MHHNNLHSVKPLLGLCPASYHSCHTQETALSRLRIGHTCLTHGYLMECHPIPLCEVCRVPISVLVDCLVSSKLTGFAFNATIALPLLTYFSFLQTTLPLTYNHFLTLPATAVLYELWHITLCVPSSPFLSSPLIPFPPSCLYPQHCFLPCSTVWPLSV